MMEWNGMGWHYRWCYPEEKHAVISGSLETIASNAPSPSSPASECSSQRKSANQLHCDNQFVFLILYILILPRRPMRWWPSPAIALQAVCTPPHSLLSARSCFGWRNPYSRCCSSLQTDLKKEWLCKFDTFNFLRAYWITSTRCGDVYVSIPGRKDKGIGFFFSAGSE